VFSEDWSSGKIDPAKWYLLRKKWGDGNHGVTPENVRIEKDAVAGRERDVLVCEAHGDQYDGPIVGQGGEKTRVGGVIVSKQFFASGRFEVVLKIGDIEQRPDGPADPKRPTGAIPAIWTYAYRYVHVGPDHRHDFSRPDPLYNPLMEAFGDGSNEYWSEVDFPEFGKAGKFDQAMYNTFCQNKVHTDLLDVSAGIDGNYHTYTTEWRTHLVDLPGVTDAQTHEAEGYWWVQDKSIPFDKYLGNPLKRLEKDHYAVYIGEKAAYWLDGKPLGQSDKLIPAMAAQLNLGIWLPKWAGPAAWKVSRARIASVKVWQYHDPGDAPGILTKDITDSFDNEGKPLKRGLK